MCHDQRLLAGRAKTPACRHGNVSVPGPVDPISRLAATAELEEQNHTLQKEGSTKDATIAELKAEIVQNSREIDLKAQMVAILKDVIANNALVESGGSTAAQ